MRIIARALWAVAVACTAAAPWAQASEPYRINAIMSLTGQGAFIAKGEQQAAQLVVKLVNASGGIKGHPIELSVQDDETNPQLAVQLAGQVLAEKPVILLGPTIVATCRAVAPLLSNGPVGYCISPGIHPDAGSYVFTGSVSTLDLANALVRYFRLKGWTRIGLMTSTDATGQDAENGLKSVLALPENKPMRVVASEHFNITDVSVTAQLEDLKAAKPQCFIAWASGNPIATIFRAMLQTGLDVPVGTTDGNMTYAQMTQYASFLPKQLYIAASQWVVRDPARLSPEVQAQHKQFYAAFDEAGARPDIASELGWDPTMALVHALRTLGPEATAIQIRDFIAHLTNFAGVDGIYDYRKSPQRGLDVSDAVVTRWNPKARTWQVVSEATGVPLP